jgi:hypothetical protein
MGIPKSTTLLLASLLTAVSLLFCGCQTSGNGDYGSSEGQGSVTTQRVIVQTQPNMLEILEHQQHLREFNWERRKEITNNWNDIGKGLERGVNNFAGGGAAFFREMNKNNNSRNRYGNNNRDRN